MNSQSIHPSMSNKDDTSTIPTTSLLNQPIVMDIGTDTTKAGFAGGSKPKIIIGTKVGRAKHVRVMPGGALASSGTTAGNDSNKGNDGVGVGSTVSSATGGSTMIQQKKGISSVFVGKALDDHRGAFILDYPMDKGCVVDGSWDDMETIWNVSESDECNRAKIMKTLALVL